MPKTNPITKHNARIYEEYAKLNPLKEAFKDYYKGDGVKKNGVCTYFKQDVIINALLIDGSFRYYGEDDCKQPPSINNVRQFTLIANKTRINIYKYCALLRLLIPCLIQNLDNKSSGNYMLNR